MLKADFHMHVRGDPNHPRIHTFRQLIDHASKLSFQVLSITNHNQVFYNQSLVNYALSKNILLIPGAEKTIQGKEVLLYNVTQEEIDQLKTFQDLENLKNKKNILVIAPHPYFLMPSCLGKKLEKHIHLFDGIEHSHFYHKLINRNHKAKKIAKKHNKPLVGTSDSHHIFQFNHTYTLVDAKKNILDIINSIKGHQIQLVTKPLSLINFLRVPLNVFLR